ncbi:MAG: CAF17-like 4Fe-4S cluster assembly/insertion protein YgfZ [Longimicrobiales bacterium]
MPDLRMSPAYEAAIAGAGVLRRRERRFVAIEGKAPGDMLRGILSGRIPAPLGEPTEGWRRGEAAYSAILTPKGRMVTDLRILPGQGGGFLLDLPGAGLAGGQAHFKKYMNPRFGRLEDRSGDLGMLTVLGPEGPQAVSTVLGFDAENPGVDKIRSRAGWAGLDLTLLGNGDVQPPAMDLLLPLAVLEEVRGRLEELGVRPIDSGTWDTLRIEAGTPVFGVDMTEDTILLEAGIEDRAIDHNKGCYTGQEVIVRIRDRGQVSKRLRWIFLGKSRVPERGTDLFATEDAPGLSPPGPVGADSERASEGGPKASEWGSGRRVGWITSACRSPRFDQTIALGFIKRRVGVGGEVRLGGPQGPPGKIRALGEESGGSA